MKKLTDEQIAWLNSPAARMLRKAYEGHRKMELDALIATGAVSADAKVCSHATALMVWEAALKELNIGNESDN